MTLSLASKKPILLCEISLAAGKSYPELRIFDSRKDTLEHIQGIWSIHIHGRQTRDGAKHGKVKLKYCEIFVMLADIMTKTLPRLSYSGV